MVTLKVEPLGFPRCASCPLLQTGAVAVCFACVTAHSKPIGADRCGVCSQTLTRAGERCRNRLCNDAGRRIGQIHAIAVYSDPVDQAIIRLKNRQWGWALIFGRLVVGWLEQNVDPGRYDLILPNPTYVDRSVGDNWEGHTERVLMSARVEDVLGRWPIVDPAVGLLTKAFQTSRSAGGALAQKEAAAEEVQRSLRLSAADAVLGRRILVYDDICTTGSQLDAVAGFLLEGGAAAVDGLVLARAPWRTT